MITPRQVVTAVLEGLDFEEPIELADVYEVHRRIVEAFAERGGPKPLVEVYQRNRAVVRDPAARVAEVVVDVREPGAVRVLEIREVKKR